MSEATTLAAEGPGENAVRAKAKVALHAVLAAEATAVNTLLLGLVPTWGQVLLPKVMSIPALQQLELTYLDKGGDELVDAVFWGADTVRNLIYEHVPEVKTIVQIAQNADNTQLAQTAGNVHRTTDEIKTEIAIAAKGKRQEWFDLGRKTFGVP